MKPDNFVTEIFHLINGVTDKNDRFSFLFEFFHLCKAFIREAVVSNRKRFVNDQDIRIHVNGDGESKAGFHAAGVSPERQVDMLADVSEVDDILEHRVDLLLREAQKDAFVSDVFQTGEIAVHSSGSGKHADLAVDCEFPFIGIGYSGYDTGKSGFSGTVQADHAQDLAFGKLKIDPLQSDEFLRLVAGEQQALQPVEITLIHRIFLDNIFTVYSKIRFHIFPLYQIHKFAPELYVRGRAEKEQQDREAPEIDTHFPFDCQGLIVQDTVPIAVQNIGERIQVQDKLQIFRQILLAPHDWRNIKQQADDSDQYFLQILKYHGDGRRQKSPSDQKTDRTEHVIGKLPHHRADRGPADEHDGKYDEHGPKMTDKAGKDCLDRDDGEREIYPFQDSAVAVNGHGTALKRGY